MSRVAPAYFAGTSATMKTGFYNFHLVRLEIRRQVELRQVVDDDVGGGSVDIVGVRRRVRRRRRPPRVHRLGDVHRVRQV
jgi:hypothetical protein